MQPGRSERLPLECYLQRVVRKDRLLVIVPLIKADALTAPDVDCRDYLYLPAPEKFELTALKLYHCPIRRDNSGIDHYY
jgi:hypothetical protein